MNHLFHRNNATDRATELDEAAIWRANDAQCSQSYRARMWRRMLLGLAVFWLAVLALIFT